MFSAEDIVGSKLDEVRLEYFANRTGTKRPPPPLVFDIIKANPNNLGPWTSPSVNVVAFPSLRSLTPNWARLLRSAGDMSNNLPSSYDETLRAGYAAQEAQLLALLNRTDSPAYELMSTSWGRLAISALQPLSRGVVEARSASVFENAPPTIDPRYCSHGLDCEVLLLGAELNARLVATAPMADLAPVPDPGFGPDDVRDRGALDATVRRLLKTEFHPSGTTAMMPREKGGVVDTRLKVYGAANLRVVDAGILPLIPDGHIQAAIYAVAERVCSDSLGHLT